MRFLSFLLPIFGLGCWALQESDVGVVDWHKEFIGIPLFSSPATAPTYINAGGKNIIITATGNNVLAAIEPDDGSIIWRYIFDPQDRIAGFYSNGNVVAALSGPGGASARSFDALTGELILEQRLHANELGTLSEPHSFGKHIAFDSASQDVYALTNGYTITRLDGNTGVSKWTQSSPDQTSLNIFFKLLPTSDALFAIGLSKSFASYTLQVTALSPSTGEIIQTTHIPSSIVDPIGDVVAFVHEASGLPFAVWLEEGAVKTFPLKKGPKGKATTLEGSTFSQLVDTGLSGLGQLLGRQEDGSALVLQLDPARSSFTILHKFDTRDAGINYAGGVDSQSRPYTARSYWDPELEKVVLDLFGAGQISSSALPFETRGQGVIDHVAIHLNKDAQPQAVITTSTGAVQAYSSATLQWTREEALATAVLAEFVELPERVAVESNVTRAEGFLHRLSRHAVQAQDLPRYLVNFVRRFATGSYASVHSSAVPSSVDDTLSRDAFGFRQVIVTATLFGKVYGIDSSNGNILWSRGLGLGLAADTGGTITPVKMFVIKTVSDGVDPEVVIVTQRRSQNSSTSTVVFHLNALTGDDLTGSSIIPEILEGVDTFQGPAVEAFLLDEESKVVILFDEFLQVYLFPDTPQTHKVFNKLYPRLSFPIRTNANGRQKVVGHQVAYKTNLSERPIAYPTWTLSLPTGETLQRLVPPAARGPVASLGKVLGNRTTLYKYLNPRLFTVLTASPTKNHCGLYLVDSTKGTTIYHKEIKDSIGCDIKTALIENWLVYHYYESEAPDGNVKGTKGYRMVTVELYEGQKIDDKSRSSDMSSFANATTDLTAYEETYIFPHAITALAPTSTKFGITSKDLIVATKNHKVQSFPRRLLNPRRPHRKPTSEEIEEVLMQYEPMIPDDPKRVISHNYEVANVQRIVTAPALLESTSLVYAFGLDMFLTRVAPSNTFDVLSENFNKVQLVFTVSGLIVAILFTRPMVQRKRLREKWYQ